MTKRPLHPTSPRVCFVAQRAVPVVFPSREATSWCHCPVQDSPWSRVQPARDSSRLSTGLIPWPSALHRRAASRRVLEHFGHPWPRQAARTWDYKKQELFFSPPPKAAASTPCPQRLHASWHGVPPPQPAGVPALSPLSPHDGGCGGQGVHGDSLPPLAPPCCGHLLLQLPWSAHTARLGARGKPTEGKHWRCQDLGVFGTTLRPARPVTPVL